MAKVRWAGDRCSVCDNEVDFDFDQLVSCDACGLTVHQSCYGVPDLPGAQAVTFNILFHGFHDDIQSINSHIYIFS